ncbi:ThrRS/AlaRS common domain-containing protein [Trematosphaeria pertusa]|uniref:ThrRS/AlaRS common domain-containing protein n=1 Tax=Trematosphaeria pertusa TaxID=390896 RepID=A0A6A6IJG4_9PLEO|nr:ThrRS/AlaRS common domain-containing protein [Trematosphaeria pertusa]KAF2250714.1 ThrRS/AlaRS common domain-containing protein [Trematosphaeria pertusa]
MAPDLSAKTIPLYQKHGHLYTHSTTLTSLSRLSSLPPETQALFKKAPEAEGEAYVVVTPETIFHAQGGGQPSDVGTITGARASAEGEEQEGTFRVLQVRRVDAAILHMGVFSPSPTHTTLSPNAPLVQNLHVPSRLLHSRLHTAGHLLGLAINLLATSGILPSDLKDGKASHYPGAAFVEFSSPSGAVIAGDKKAVIQAKVDELIAEDLDVRIHFWSRQQAERKCIGGVEGTAVGEGEEVRVVEIGEGGCYACGGTHVKRLGELGRVVVRGVKRQRGVSKVGYEVLDG